MTDVKTWQTDNQSCGWRVAKGSMRWVILSRRYAIKLTRLKHWRWFLEGLIANLEERELSRRGDKRLCPVIGSLPLGFAIVMPRARPLSADEWERFDPVSFVLADQRESLPIETKSSSYGVVDGEIVALITAAVGVARP